MNAIRRRLPAPTAQRLQRDAGPPDRWVLAALVAAGAAWILLASQIGTRSYLPTVVALAILAVPGLVDIDGWRARLGMSWLAAEQARRAPGLPRTAAGAERWLSKEANPSPLLRATVLGMAGHTAEARALILSAPIETAEDRARVARMLAASDGLERGELDPSAALDAIDALPADQQRYHRIALAWSTAWIASTNKRPWRRAFAQVSRGIDPRQVPLPRLIWLTLQQNLLPLCFAVVIVIADVFVRL